MQPDENRTYLKKQKQQNSPGTGGAHLSNSGGEGRRI
jgi:hypothetical protein